MATAVTISNKSVWTMDRFLLIVVSRISKIGIVADAAPVDLSNASLSI